MARPPDKSSASQFKTSAYTQSWAANNPYYASHVNWAFNTQDTTRTQAAAKSGIVHTAGYSNITPQNRGISQSDPTNWASPTRRGTAYDRFGNVNKQRGDVQLGLVLMGGYQFPGQAFSPERTKLGGWRPNVLSRWMNAQGKGGHSPINLRARNMRRETGWQTQLSYASPAARGQSSEDSTLEMYSTQETRMGTRAQFTDEVLDERTGKVGRTWAGFKPLATHSSNPYYGSKLQMYGPEVSNVGAARRVQRSGF